MIASKTWRELRTLGLIYTGLLLLEHVIAIWQYPILRTPTVLRAIPADFMARWIEGLTDRHSDAAYRAYIALEIFFKGANIVGLAGAVLLGAGLIARERENQTLEFLLSRPVTRAGVLFGKYWVALLIITLPILLTAWATIPLSHWLIGESLPFAQITLAAGYQAVFCALFLTATLLCSVLFATQGRVTFTIGSIIAFELSLYFIQGVRVASIFRLTDFDVYGPVLAGNMPAAMLFWERGLWLLLAIAILYSIAARVFTRQEL